MNPQFVIVYFMFLFLPETKANSDAKDFCHKFNESQEIQIFGVTVNKLKECPYLNQGTDLFSNRTKDPQIQISGYIAKMNATYHQPAVKVTFIFSTNTDILVRFTLIHVGTRNKWIHSHEECYDITYNRRKGNITYDCPSNYSNLKPRPTLLQMDFSYDGREYEKTVIMTLPIISNTSWVSEDNQQTCNLQPFVLTDVTNNTHPQVTIQTACSSMYKQNYSLFCAGQRYRTVFTNKIVSPAKSVYSMVSQGCSQTQNYYFFASRKDSDIYIGEQKPQSIVQIVCCVIFSIVFLLIVTMIGVHNRRAKCRRRPSVMFYVCHCQRHQIYLNVVKQFMAFLEENCEVNVEMSGEDTDPQHSIDFHCVVPLPTFQNHAPLEYQLKKLKQNQLLLLKFPFLRPNDVLETLPYEGKHIATFQMMEHFIPFLRAIHGYHPYHLQTLMVSDAWLDKIEHKLLLNSFTDEAFSIICDQRYSDVLDNIDQDIGTDSI